MVNSTLNPSTEIYVCGKTPSSDEGIVITIGSYCI
jgi:hypothetical protein